MIFQNELFFNFEFLSYNFIIYKKIFNFYNNNIKS